MPKKNHQAGVAQSVIVDGHNVILRTPRWAQQSRTDSAAARAALVAHAGAWASSRRDVRRVTIVFDGPSAAPGTERTPFAAVRVVYASEHQTADGAIVALVREASAAGKIAVVTEDRELGDRCCALGARLLSLEIFRQLRAPGGRTRSAPGAQEASDKDGLSPADRREINEMLRREWGID